MGMNPRTVTEAGRAASRANGGHSAGPRTAEGKEHSKMNALKHGRYAARPRPAEPLAGNPEEEAAEREAWRRDCIPEVPRAMASRLGHNLAVPPAGCRRQMIRLTWRMGFIPLMGGQVDGARCFPERR